MDQASFLWARPVTAPATNVVHSVRYITRLIVDENELAFAIRDGFPVVWVRLANVTGHHSTFAVGALPSFA